MHLADGRELQRRHKEAAQGHAARAGRWRRQRGGDRSYEAELAAGRPGAQQLQGSLPQALRVAGGRSLRARRQLHECLPRWAMCGT